MNFQTGDTIKIKDTPWTIRSIHEMQTVRYGWTHSVWMQHPKGAVYFSSYYNAKTGSFSEPIRVGRLTKNEQ